MTETERDRTIDANAEAKNGWSWAFSNSNDFGGLIGVFSAVVFAALLMAGLGLAAAILVQHDLSVAQAATTEALSTARSEAAYARAKAEDAKTEAERAQRQADLANWTVLNLEGLMKEKGINVPDSLRPKNLSGNDGAKRK